MRIEFKKTVKADVDTSIVAEAVMEYIEEYILDAFDDVIDTDEIPAEIKKTLYTTVAIEILNKNEFSI